MTGSFHSESLPALKALLSIINVFIGMRYLTHFSQQDDKAVMKSKRAASIVLLLLACCPLTCYGNAYEEASYVILIKAKKSDDAGPILERVRSCHKCLIKSAKVTVISSKVVAPFLSTVKVRALTHGFERIQIYCNFEKICPALHRLRLRNLPTSTLSNGIDGEKQLSENAIDSLPAPEMELAQLLRHSGSKKPQNTYCTLLKMLQRYTLRARIDESVIPTQLSQFALERFRIILRTKLYV
uniref:AlNc14C195G8559 protein n=1 Tax=Albugo laibachii Nc14 TaxID=890382 RepID=F0WQ78_9STRA|nr:AlNc14C195G8559 [Albugo laibachii Nc14]|eukprot:CCA23484.1 AlNc14C195G8559 [Albugo laibachii Nc14]